MLLGKYDILIIAITLLANILSLTRIKESRFSSIVKNLAFPSYLFLFPYFSSILEVNSINQNNGVVDGFNTFYLGLKYPVYWALGLINWGIIYWIKSFKSIKQKTKRSSMYF